jgi:hypothetical protein
MRSNFLRQFLMAGLAVVWAASAGAYDIIRDNGRIVKWQPGVITFEVKLGTAATLSDSSNYSQSFIAAMDSWNGVMGNLQFAGNIAAAGPGADRNGINETFFAANVYGEAFGENTIAVTVSFRTSTVQPDGSYRRTQSDIVFNSNRTWDSYRGPRRAAIDFRRVAMHELGHVLGLDHPDEAGQTVAAIMNSRVGDVDALQNDDIQGAQFLYGAPGSVTRPANNDFSAASAITLTNNAATVTGTNTHANKETGEPNHAPNELGGASVWWRWTASASGSMQITTAGSNFDTMLAAYTGTAVNALTQLAANDDVQAGVIRTSTITFDVTSGTTYYIAVDGWQGEWGNITLNLNFTPASAPPANTAPAITAQPQSQTVNTGATVNLSVTASGTPAPTYQWFRNGAAISGATGATLTLTNVQTSDAGTYTVTVTNTAGSVTSNPATLTVNAATPAPIPAPTPTPAPTPGGGGGGGAPSIWFIVAFACAAFARAWRRHVR